MAFDTSTRNLLARFVAAARTLITEEFTQQFQQLYGLAASGAPAPLAALTHLDEAGLATAERLRERLDYLQKNHPETGANQAAALQRLSREQAFTVLNRLAALRMAEKRGIIVESVGKGFLSKGFLVFSQAAGSALGETYDRYRCYLACLFDELAQDLGSLFSRHSPYALLFPRESSLQKLIALLNAPELESLWAEDETIGWIYQYYNDPAERKKMREESAAPRNSRELAVRNQFFTPRYVVEFLTDNTLGRIWYEMTKGKTQLKDTCRYLVRRPNEVFLGNPSIITHLDSAAPWVRDVILTGNFTDLPENPSLSDLSDLGLAIDGYGEIERRGRNWDEFIETFYNPQAVAAEQSSSPWSGDAFELWCALFTYQRNSLRNGGYTNQALAADDDTLRHLWPALRRALQAPPSDLSQEELLRLPVFIPHRPLKDPREILMLDPACGSMHFGLYAFDLFEIIYEEHWDLNPDNSALAASSVVNQPLHELYPDKQSFLYAVPRLIIEHNIHGIDIDSRAVQIAGLSLWLRAQKSWQRIGLRPADRPTIKRSNIVCAEPMPGEKQLLSEFVTREFPAEEQAVCLKLLESIFDKMQLAGEAGSLLKIEEEIRTAIEDARKAWQKLQNAPAELFSTSELNTVSAQQELVTSASISLLPATFFTHLEERIYAALRDYAEQAETSGGFQRRLFAEDAARGFAFIDVCRKRYDVALMNPPFGAASKLLQTRLEQLGFQGRDLAADFISNSLRLAAARGFIGAITTRTIFFLKGFLDWRYSLVNDYGGTRCFLDIGFGVLDAAVEACAFTVEASKASFMGHFFRGLGQNSQMESGGAESVARTPQFLMDANSFTRIPRQPFAYWCSPKLLSAFEQSAKVGDSFDVLSGGNPRDDFRFIRHWVEIPTKSPSDFVPYSKGGEFAFYYFDVHLMLKWAEDGKELKVQAAEYRRQLGWSPDWRALMMNYDRYFTAGITWPRRTSRLSFRFLPRGCVFGDKSPVILSRSQDLDHLFPLVGYLNTSTFNDSLNLMVGSSELAQSFEVGIVKSCPLPKANEERQGAIVRDVFRKLYDLDTVNEDSHAYVGVALHNKSCRSLDAAFREFRDVKGKIVQEIVESQHELERLAHEALGTERAPSTLSAADFDEVGRGAFVVDFISQLFGSTFGRWDIRYATDEQATPELPDPFAPLPICPPGQLQNAQGLPALPEDVPAEYPVRIPWNGILVDDPSHDLDIERRVREVIEIIWQDRAEAIEHEACEILGVKSLRDYFRKPTGFFADHLKRYSKSRRQAPIYWPLSTASGSYTLWIYYHRLTDQTLHTALADFLLPKISEVEKELTNLQQSNSPRAAEVKDFHDELANLRDEIERIIKLPWKPNLNDGVLITASPLSKLFRLPKWKKDLQACWTSLQKGDYDWAHLAYTIWPTRVEKAVEKDRSLAIAHNLEHLCKIEPPKPKAKKAAKKAAKKKGKDDEMLDF